MLNKLIKYMYHFIIFIFIFSVFNDDFLVHYFGDNILKMIIILFIVSAFSDILINIKTMNTLSDKIFFTFIGLLLLVFLLQNIINMADNILKPTFALLSMIVIVLFFSRYPINKFLYFVWFSIVFSIMICYFNEPLTEYTFRKTGGTGDPNNFAAQLLAFIFTSFYLYTQNKSKVYLLISILFFTYGLFAAGSKSAFLIFAIITLFGILIKMKRLITPKNLLILMIPLIGMTQIDFSKIEAVSNMLGRANETKTAGTRFASWIAGLHMVEKHPILGVGMGQYSKNSPKYAETILREGSTAPHNTYIQLIAETGVIVFSVFIFFLYVLMMKNLKIIINSEIFWIYFALLSLLLMGLTLGLTYLKFQWLFIAIMMQIHYLISKGKLK